MNLKEKLIHEDKNRWLDVGNGGNFESGFYYLDILPILESYPDSTAADNFVKAMSKINKSKYFSKDILKLTKEDFEELGTFDFVRMQHFFEHLTLEEGQIALSNISKLLKPGGIITISTPDLRVHIDKYLNNGYKTWDGFKWWANKRISEDAPDSYYFSIFAHSMPWEQHKWCYDYEGLEYQLKTSKKFVGISELKLTDELANVPFTHNRPEEDVCIIATKK